MDNIIDDLETEIRMAASAAIEIKNKILMFGDENHFATVPFIAGLNGAMMGIIQTYFPEDDGEILKILNKSQQDYFRKTKTI
jgi:hypothetical protein